MTNRERIEDNYEDALFAIWMDDFAQRRGAKLIEENERLKNDPNAAVPEHLQRKNLNIIFRELRRNAHTFTFKRIGTVALRFLAAALILIALFGCAYAVSPEFRTGTLNLLMQLDEKAASFQLVDDATVPGTQTLMPTVTIGWLPEGYKGENPVYDRIQTTVNCLDPNGNSIRVRVFTEHQTNYNLDIEEADTYEEITIQGQPALLVKKEGMLRILWTAESTSTYIFVNSSALNADTLIQVAESISVSW